MRQSLSLFVSKGRSKLKFIPNFDGATRRSHFEVDVPRLAQASADVRESAELLCQVYLNAAIGGPGNVDVNVALRRLARVGHELKNIVFEDPTAREYADEIARTSPLVTFFADQRLPVGAPYGLMFGAPSIEQFQPSKLSEQQLRQGFWGPKYGVSVVYTPMDQFAGGYGTTFNGPRTKVFGVFHPEALDYASPAARQAWPRETVAFSASEFKDRWAAHAADHNILYFFCHADGKQLVIGNTGQRLDDILLPHAFRACIRDCGLDRPGGLLILNGCKTGILRQSHSWLEATRISGFMGFIGTEASVPTKFAWPFGNDLLHMLASGESPLQALQTLWSQHWPLGLLYGLYCVADVTVQPRMQLPFLTRPQMVNYSSLPFGEGRCATLPFSKQ